MTQPPLITLSGHLGVLLVAANVLLEQIGLPVPAMPTLIVAGALAASGSLSMGELFAAATLLCIMTDAGWYLTGLRYGNRVMKLLCRISLTPDSCVSETQSQFERWGPNALLVAKFIPGLALIAPPLAGATHMAWPRFLCFTGVGSALWVGSALAAGALLRPQILQLLPRLTQAGGISVLILAALLAAYVVYKWWERRRFYASLRMARMTVGELYERLRGDAAPVVVDVRSATALRLEPRRIPGALCLPLENFDRHVNQLPQDRDIVLYCTCPNEASAAQVAKLLMKHGFTRVRPLEGGLDAWLAAGHAVEALSGITESPTSAAASVLES